MKSDAPCWAVLGLFGWGAFACQAATALALAFVAEGFIKSGVRAFGRVCKDAAYYQFCSLRKGFVGLVARGLSL